MSAPTGRATRHPATIGTRWRDRDTRTGVRVVEVVDTERNGRYVHVRRVYPPGSPARGTGGRVTRILVAGLWHRFDYLPGNVAAVVPVPDQVEAAVRVALVAWNSDEALVLARDTYGAQKSRGFDHARNAADDARLTYAVRAALAHQETRP